MMLSPVGLLISAIVFSLKSLGNVHPLAVASTSSSLMMSDIISLTPVFSSNFSAFEVSKMTLTGWKAIGLHNHRQLQNSTLPRMHHSPNHSLVLLLPDVRGHFAVDLTCAKSHCEGLRHVLLNCRGNVVVLAGRANPDLS
jgi:hypothetical protein